MTRAPHNPWIEPCVADWENMSPETSGRFLREFRERASERAESLTAAVRATPGFEDFSADYSRDSLLRLGEWVKASFRSERRLPDEVRITGRLPPAIASDLAEMYRGIPETYIDAQQSYLILDIGFYIAIHLLRKHPWLKWKRCSAPTSPWFNQPCLPAYGNHGFAPIHEAATVAYAIVEDRVRTTQFAEMADRWSSQYAERAPHRRT